MVDYMYLQEVDNTCIRLTVGNIPKVLCIFYILAANTTFLSWLEVLTFEKTEGINHDGLATSIITAVLTQPMLQIIAALFYKSCNGTLAICNKGQIIRNIQYEIFNIDKEKDVSNNGEVDNAQTGNAEISKEENIDTSETMEGSDSTKNVASIIQATKSYVDLNTLNEVQGEFANLTKAWSPMFLTVFVCESIMLINAGFVVSKNILNEIPFIDYQKDAFHELFTMVYFLCNSVAVLSFICIVAEWTNNEVKDYSHAVRSVSGFFIYRTKFGLMFYKQCRRH